MQRSSEEHCHLFFAKGPSLLSSFKWVDEVIHKQLHCLSYGSALKKLYYGWRLLWDRFLDESHHSKNVGSRTKDD
jgi:hypothetical protein